MDKKRPKKSLLNAIKQQNWVQFISADWIVFVRLILKAVNRPDATIGASGPANGVRYCLGNHSAHQRISFCIGACFYTAGKALFESRRAC